MLSRHEYHPTTDLTVGGWWDSCLWLYQNAKIAFTFADRFCTSVSYEPIPSHSTFTEIRLRLSLFLPPILDRLFIR